MGSRPGLEGSACAPGSVVMGPEARARGSPWVGCAGRGGAGGGEGGPFFEFDAQLSAWSAFPASLRRRSSQSAWTHPRKASSRAVSHRFRKALPPERSPEPARPRLLSGPVNSRFRVFASVEPQRVPFVSGSWHRAPRSPGSPVWHLCRQPLLFAAECWYFIVRIGCSLFLN